MVAAEDGIAEFAAQGCVAADAIDQRAGDLPAVGHLGHDVAPHGHRVAAAVVEHDDGTGRDVVNEVADGARRVRGRTVQDREGAPGHAEARIAWLDAVALPGDVKYSRCRLASLQPAAFAVFNTASMKPAGPHTYPRL